MNSVDKGNAKLNLRDTSRMAANSFESVDSSSDSVDILSNGDEPVASAKFATVGCNQPFRLPVRELTLTLLQRKRSDSWDSLDDDGGDRSQLAAKKFEAAECGQPLEVPPRYMTPSPDSLNGFLSPSAKFAKGCRPLQIPVCQRTIVSDTLSESYRSFDELSIPEGPQRTESSTLQIPVCQRIIVPDTLIESYRSFGDLSIPDGSQRTEISGGSIYRDRTLRTRNGAKDYNEEPYRNFSDNDILVNAPENPPADGLGLSGRFSMAEFEEPLSLPLRQQSCHGQSHSTFDSLTDNDSLESFDIDLGRR